MYIHVSLENEHGCLSPDHLPRGRRLCFWVDVRYDSEPRKVPLRQGNPAHVVAGR